MKKNYAVILSPLIVAILSCILFLVYGMYPLGDKTLAWCDMNQQVVPILLQFRDILMGKSSMFLNMQNAGGMNFWGVFLFFISSPFSFLTVLIPKAYMTVFMNIFVVLRLMVCAFTATLFFSLYFKKLGNPVNCILGIMYAFSGYAMLFYQNVVWLDMMYMFPLLLIGVNKLINDNKICIYVTTLSATIFIHFHISFMVIVFLIIYMGLYIIIMKPNNKGKILSLFAISSLISVAITSVVWLPTFFQYLNSARGDNIIKNLASGSFFAPVYTTSMILLCSLIIIAIIPFCFTNFVILKKDIMLSFVIFILMAVPLFIDPINKMCHMGSYQAFPARYGYITTFCGLIVVATILSNIDSNRIVFSEKKFVVLISGLLFAFYAFGLFLLAYYKNKMGSYVRTLWVNKTSFILMISFYILGIACYFLSTLLWKKRKISKGLFVVVIGIVSIGEILFNCSVFIGTAVRSDFTYRQSIALEGQVNDSEFYRVKQKHKYFDVNRVGGIGYNSLGHYTSLTSKDYMFTMKTLGYSCYWMEVSSVGGSKFTDAIFSNKYIIKKNDDIDIRDEVVYFGDIFCLVKNPYFLPLGIKTKSDLSKCEEIQGNSRFDCQEYMAKLLFSTNNKIFNRYDYLSAENIEYKENGGIYSIKKKDDNSICSIKYSIDVTSRETLYFDCFMYLSNKLKEPINDSFKVKVNGVIVQNKYPNQSSNGLLELGTFENESVEIEVILYKNIECKSFGVYGLDEINLKDLINDTQGVNLKVVGNRIIGNCNASSNEYLYISAPYYNGYTAKVNGEYTQVYKTFDSFLSIKLNKGENQIELEYIPRGFRIGVLLTILGVLFLITFIVFIRNHPIIRIIRFEKFITALFYSVFYITICSIYLIPILIRLVL